MIWETLLWAGAIFASRVVDVGMGTIRVQLIVRRHRLLAALIGFVEVLIFILIVSRVIAEVGDWKGWESLIPAVAYAGGFAVGTMVGITLSQRMGRGVVEATIITHQPWVEMETPLREAGFALTRHQGVGREGQVEVLTVVCAARELPRLIKAATGVDPKAFVYTQELAGLRGGYVYGVKSKL